MPLITVTPAQVARNSIGNVLVLVASGLTWTPGSPGSPTFEASAGSITSQSVTDNGRVVLTYDAQNATGTVEILDPVSGVSTVLVISADTDQVLTRSMLEDAAADALTLALVVNGAAFPGTVISRLGQEYKTLAAILHSIELTDVGGSLASSISDLVGQINDVAAAAVAQATADAAQFTALAASLATEATTRGSADDDIHTSITGLSSTVGSNTTAISTEAATRASADVAINALITTLTSTVSGNTASITSEASTRATADSALSLTLSGLNSRMGTAESNITSISATEASHNSAQATLITNLTSKTDTTNANLITEQTTRATADTALTTSISGLSSTVAGNTSSINSEASTRATADTAINASLSSLTSTVSGHTAQIATEAATRATADSALSALVSALQTTVDGVSANVTNESGARIDGDEAIAGNLSFLTSVTSGMLASYNANPLFGLWSATPGLTAAGLPDTWINFTQVNAGATNNWTYSRVAPGRSSPYGFGLVSDATHNSGLKQDDTTTAAMQGVSPGWYVIELDLTLNGGFLSSIGARFTSSTGNLSTGGADLKCATDPDINGVIQGNGTTGKSYSFRKLIQVTDTGTTGNMMFVVGSWSHWGTLHSSDITIWRADVRAASSAEIEAHQATGDIATTRADLTSESTTRTTADSALSSRIDTLNATVSGHTAAISSETSARVSGDSANASSITSLTTRMNNAESNITVAQSSIDGVKANYTIQTTVMSNGKAAVTGMELISGTGGQSEIDFWASRFVITNSTATVAKIPFVVAADGSVHIDNTLYVGTINTSQIVAGSTLITSDLVSANLFQGAYFQAGVTANGFVAMKGDIDLLGSPARRYGPYFVCQDNAGNTRAIMGQWASKWGLHIWDANGNQVLDSGALGSGVVGTGNIGPNAVNVPLSIALAHDFTGSGVGTYKIVIPATNITVSDNAQLEIVAVFSQGYTGTDPTPWAFRLYIDGSVVKGIGGGFFNTNPVLAYSDRISPGTHSIKFDWYAATNGTLSDAVISVMGVLR